MPVMPNHAGRTFGRITLSAPVPGKSGYWKGTCSCGNPVEKRIDNLKRPGDHSCGRCYPTTLGPDAVLEERVRRLEVIVSRLNLDLIPPTHPDANDHRTLTDPITSWARPAATTPDLARCGPAGG